MLRFPLNTFIPVKFVDFEDLHRKGFTLEKLFDHVGWTTFLRKNNYWNYEAYAWFWCRAVIKGNSFEVEVEGKLIRINPSTVLQANSLTDDGAVYRLWDSGLSDVEVDRVLYGQVRSQGASSAVLRNFLKSSNLVPLGRVVHNLLFNIVLPRTGSRDHVSDKDRFVLFHILQLQKVNLPLLICEHWEQALRDRSAAKRKTPIP